LGNELVSVNTQNYCSTLEASAFRWKKRRDRGKSFLSQLVYR